MSDHKKYPLNAWALMSTIVSQLAGSILVGIFLGKWIDGKFDTFPIFLVIGLLLGLATGVLGTIRILAHFTEKEEGNND